MATTEKWIRGTSDSLTLSSTSVGIGAAVGGTYTPSSAGYTKWEVFVTFNPGSAPVAGAAVLIFFLRDNGSLTFETGSATGPVIPARPADVVAPAEAATGGQSVCLVMEESPPGPTVQVLVSNQTGVALTGVSVVITPFTRQGV